MDRLGLNRLEDLALPMSFVRQLTALGEMKGKQDLYKVQRPEMLDTLRQVAVVLSTESSNRIENVVVEPRRLQDLMAHRTEPQNRPESEVAGYRDVLQAIHSSWEYMTLSPNLILQLHRDLYQYAPQPGGTWKRTDNQIIEKWPDGTTHMRFGDTTPAHRTGEAMEQLCRVFSQLRDGGHVDDLVLIGVFVLDFLCIHPFSDGNGRMARLLTLLLLYQAGHQVGRYISLERVVEDTKVSYYSTLHRSSQGWRTGDNDLYPWLTYFAGVLQAAYGQFERRVGQAVDATGAKSEVVRQAILSARQPFTGQDIQLACPTVSHATVRKVFTEMKQAGQIRCLGKGRSARWVRI